MEKINVREIVEVVKNDVREAVSKLEVKPKLVTILVGEDKASAKYVSNKIKVADSVGIRSSVYNLKDTVTEDELTSLIMSLNLDEDVHGILLQLPIPKHLNAVKHVNEIDPKKDVDGLTFINQGKLFNGMRAIEPCTPKGIMEILDNVEESLDGKHICVIGRSNLLGKPLATMLTKENATVTLCHSYTEDLFEHTRGADIVISCTGQHGIINPYMMAHNALVIDAGTTFVNGKLKGDFDPTLFSTNPRPFMRYTPVPSGVGLTTTAMLMFNTLECYKLQMGGIGEWII